MLRLRLLGTPEISLAQASPTEALSSKAQAILYYLAVTGRPQPRSALATLLWGDTPDGAARTNLRKALAQLRRSLGDYLDIDRHTVAFKSDGVPWVDVVEFETHVKASPDAKHLQAAVELYRGDFLAGFYVLRAPDFETWQLVEQARLRELVVQVLHTLTDHHAGPGELTEGIAYTRQLLSLEPWREEAHRQMMLLLAQNGQRSAALAQFETCRQILADELGVEPGRETVTLYERIRDGELSRGAALTGGFAQAQRSRDEVFSPAPPPLRAPAPPPRHNLPQQPTPFIGREKEQADIIRRLTDRDCRLLALVGPGGIGKTRLALQAAQRLLDSPSGEPFFANGILFVPLTAVESTSEIVAAIAAAANFSFYSNVPPNRQLLDYLQEKELLLILDNLEHLLSSPGGEPTGATGLIADMLTAAPRVKILATSREALNMQQAWFHPVEGLAFPAQAVETPSAETIPLEKYDAVRLFVQNAQRARVSFSLAAERAHVVKICRLVGGMPLAIELATAWLKVLPVAKIAHELEHNLDLLSTRLQNIPARHRSMRAVFEQSWQLLAEAERNALKALSVFKGSFDQPAAEQVAGASLMTLAILVEKSLLRVTAQGRYYMHELLRQFAAERLAAAPLAERAAQARHSSYYLDFLNTRQPLLTGQAQQTAVAEIGEEIENIRTAWLWAVEQNDLAAVDQALAGCFNFYLIRSRLQEGEEIFAHVLNHLERAAGPGASTLYDIVRARASIRRGTFCYFLGDYEAANRYVEAALTTELGLEYQSDVAFAHLVLGVIAGWQGKKEQAEAQLHQSLALSRDIDDKENMADALHEWAFISGTFGDYAEAKRLGQDSLTLSRAQARPDWVAHALVSLGWASVCLGEYVEAEACYREALTIFETLGSRHGVADVLDSLGWVAWCKGGAHLATAGQYYERSLAIMREIGHRRLIANTLCDLAILANETEDYALARELSHEGLRLANELDSVIYQVSYLGCLGQTACGLGDYAESRRYLKEALRRAFEIKLWPSLTHLLFEFATLLVKESDATTNPQSKALALQLLTVIIQHPTTWQAIRDRAAPLQAQLEAELPADAAAAAKAHGQNQTLAEVVTALLQRDEP